MTASSIFTCLCRRYNIKFISGISSVGHRFCSAYFVQFNAKKLRCSKSSAVRNTTIWTLPIRTQFANFITVTNRIQTVPNTHYGNVVTRCQQYSADSGDELSLFFVKTTQQQQWSCERVARITEVWRRRCGTRGRVGEWNKVIMCVLH